MDRKDGDKPPYKVPLIEEISALPTSRLKVVSTFTGAGGSCLGFRMAGFETVWASEFVPAAREVYALNFPSVPLDSRDIRDVRPEEILEVAGLSQGEVDVMEGSPPCASFSTAGKREKHWGEVVKYSDVRQRVDDLFFEFARLVEGVQPRVFVAENVSGLVKGKAKGYFKEILAALRACGYRVQARLLDAQWLGVPQMRQRIIFVGVRNDLGVKPAHPSPLPFRYTVREALPWIMDVKLQKHGPNSFDVPDDMVDRSACTVGTGPDSGTYSRHQVIHDTSGNRSQGDITDRPSPAVTVGVGGLNSEHFRVETSIEGYAIGTEWEKMYPGDNSEKYINLKKAPINKPSQTISQIGGQSPGIAAVTHPVEKRKFTIAELRRICAFPDDFALIGSYAQQWERLGRAVPPVMMWHVARVIRDEILNKVDGQEPWGHDPPCLAVTLGNEVCAG